MTEANINHKLSKLGGSVIHNQYYNVPHNVSSMFTGRQGICQELEEKCLPSKADGVQNEQMRFVLYGLGGSGKTQVCLKFAQDNREKYASLVLMASALSCTTNANDP